MKPDDSEIWNSILYGLPTHTADPTLPPLPEILKTIRFCLKDHIELYDAAIALLDTLSKLRHDIDFLNWKAMVEYHAKKYIRSYQTCEQILSYMRNDATLFNAGRAAYKANELIKSEEYLKKAWDFEPLNSSYALDYAVTICAMGRFDEALAIIENIPKESLDELHSRIVDFNKGWHYIRLGDFKKGIAHLHIGREINIWGSDSRQYNRPKWDGKTYAGKTILIAGEGGIGDEVINARFSQVIRDRGMKAVMSTVHNNISMLSSVKALDKVFDSASIDGEAWDYWAPCMDLPYLLGIDDSDIPHHPYLSAQPDYIRKWKDRTHSTKFKIGIRWSGNPRYELELARTIDIKMFEQYLNIPGTQLFSLQKDDGLPNFKIPKNAIDLSSELLTWDDTMAAIVNMDLVITSCTSIAHVAGALGVPTWVVVPLLPYYTWTDMKKTSYWYDTVTLYRQKVHCDWNHPFKEIHSDLKYYFDKSARYNLIHSLKKA